MIRVLIVDDHTIMRQGLIQILAETTDIFVASEARDGHEALQKARTGSFDVILLDIAMPIMDGYTVLKQLRHEFPRLPVLVLSMHSEEQHALRSLKAGAAGYVTKVSASEELIRAIRRVASGGRFISPNVAEQIVLSLNADGERPLYEHLSDREFQVMRLIAAGKSVGDIATELSLSVKTVSTYRARILEKLGLKNNAELMRYAIEKGLA